MFADEIMSRSNVGGHNRRIVKGGITFISQGYCLFSECMAQRKKKQVEQVSGRVDSVFENRSSPIKELASSYREGRGQPMVFWAEPMAL